MTNPEGQMAIETESSFAADGEPRTSWTDSEMSNFGVRLRGGGGGGGGGLRQNKEGGYAFSEK